MYRQIIIVLCLMCINIVPFGVGQKPLNSTILKQYYQTTSTTTTSTTPTPTLTPPKSLLPATRASATALPSDHGEFVTDTPLRTSFVPTNFYNERTFQRNLTIASTNAATSFGGAPASATETASASVPAPINEPTHLRGRNRKPSKLSEIRRNLSQSQNNKNANANAYTDGTEPNHRPFAAYPDGQHTSLTRLRDRQKDDPKYERQRDPMKILMKEANNNHNNNNNRFYKAAATPNMSTMDDKYGVKCSFETKCAWTWNTTVPDGFQVVTGANLTAANQTGMVPGPAADCHSDANGHFLHLPLDRNTPPRVLESPTFSTTRQSCFLEMFLHQSSMSFGKLRIIIEPLDSQGIPWVHREIEGDDLRRWELQRFPINRVTIDFKILFEVVPNSLGNRPRGHVSIDNLQLVNCYPELAQKDRCITPELKCNANKVAVCIKTPGICDISVDCDNGEDELLNCDKIPFGGRCNFENGWCGWKNTGKAIMLWTRNQGPTPTHGTGPDADHTFSNASGHYLMVNMNQHANDSEKKKLAGFASNAVINSVIFNPPPLVHLNQSSPYRNSCMIRGHVHQYGMNAGSVNLSVVEMREKENATTMLWWSSKKLDPDWYRIELPLPNITNKYYFQIEARMGMRIFSDVAIDDFSLSPECFGLNIPPDLLNGYNYYDPRIPVTRQMHSDFETKPVTKLTACGVRGRTGPTADNCVDAYNNTEIVGNVRVNEKPPFQGVQVWRVPSEGYYTIIAKGAGGGLGSGGVGSSRGAVVVTVLELHKDEEIYVLIGQAGENACIKSIGYRDELCEPLRKDHVAKDSYTSKTQLVKQIHIYDGTGGGGGGTFVFLLNSVSTAVPLVVAGGGGGLGIGRYLEDKLQHGQGVVTMRLDESGHKAGEAGAGAGWRDNKDSDVSDLQNGMALLHGGHGGTPCFPSRGIHGYGGFGGGGGGCSTGGGGGGYAGGNSLVNETNGEGGTSFITPKRTIKEFTSVLPGANSGSGSLIIIPALQGCGCDYRCVSLDEYRSEVACICPEGWKLKSDNYTACELMNANDVPMDHLIIFFIVVTFFLIVALASLIFMLYNRYQRKKQAALRHKMLLEQDLQLSRLRSNGDDLALTNFNPNYGCEGILNGNVDVKSLPQVARESLRLVKALGQGAFGEVFQGLYRHRDGDVVEMPVAVKTLPEMSTNQAESDFLMEAAIMAKFNHPNIVHLIGVCFDRHPRFIVLELLAGGDLKNFLREGRNKPERPSPLSMKDLVFCAVDVAKGCRYMESKRFIHRDIAARNCLLSSKGPGRVVKIADFGMARDIYRCDYYRKGGKAMLPIKWMPPEAFLDGLFTSKTDVWSFGVLLWEVFSLGLMPYTGLPNRDVMQLVTGGGRLDAPTNCPPIIYRIMADCWNPTPDARPTFAALLERLTTCTQDLTVMNAPLPNFFRAPSTERDQTIMRPPGNDEFFLQIPISDYLIPINSPRTNAERLMHEVTGVTLSQTVATSTEPTVVMSNIRPDNGCWETSFTQDVRHVTNDPPSLPAHVDYKLISLDTPQQTPITAYPPGFFPPSHSPHPCIHRQKAALITLDPMALEQQQLKQNNSTYANVRMTDYLQQQQQQQQQRCPNNSTVDVQVIDPSENKKMPYVIQEFTEQTQNQEA